MKKYEITIRSKEELGILPLNNVQAAILPGAMVKRITSTEGLLYSTLKVTADNEEDAISQVKDTPTFKDKEDGYWEVVLVKEIMW